MLFLPSESGGVVNVSVFLPYMCPLAFIASDPVGTESESFQSLEWQLVFPDKKPEKLQFPKNFRGNIRENKIGFLRIIISVPCMTDKAKLKMAKRTTNITREKRVCRTGGSSSVLRCPEVTGSCPVTDCLQGLYLKETNLTSILMLIWNYITGL